jgi:hypothetical protein
VDRVDISGALSQIHHGSGATESSRILDVKTLALALASSLALPHPALAATLENAAYESHRMVEPLVPAEDLERHLVAQETRRYEVEVREGRPWPNPTKKQKQTILGFMAGGAILGAIAAGTFGALIGLAAGGMVCYLLYWAEIL